jgi:hypothetical protein
MIQVYKTNNYLFFGLILVIYYITKLALLSKDEEKEI